jgi:hypothetical protein
VRPVFLKVRNIKLRWLMLPPHATDLNGMEKRIDKTPNYKNLKKALVKISIYMYYIGIS